MHLNIAYEKARICQRSGEHHQADISGEVEAGSWGREGTGFFCVGVEVGRDLIAIPRQVRFSLFLGVVGGNRKEENSSRDGANTAKGGGT
jgi:hypothetical protein